MSTEKNTAKVRDQHRLQDKGLKATAIAIPTDNAEDLADVIDLGFALPNFKDARLSDFGVGVKVPGQALTTILPNTKIITVNLYVGTTATPTTAIANVVMTGVTGVDPSPDLDHIFKLPTDCPRYIRCGITCTSSTAKVGNLEVGLVF